jgi:hypothetical protein
VICQGQARGSHQRRTATRIEGHKGITYAISVLSIQRLQQRFAHFCPARLGEQLVTPPRWPIPTLPSITTTTTPPPLEGREKRERLGAAFPRRARRPKPSPFSWRSEFAFPVCGDACPRRTAKSTVPPCVDGGPSLCLCSSPLLPSCPPLMLLFLLSCGRPALLPSACSRLYQRAFSSPEPASKDACFRGGLASQTLSSYRACLRSLGRRLAASAPCGDSCIARPLLHIQSESVSFVSPCLTDPWLPVPVAPADTCRLHLT